MQDPIGSFERIREFYLAYLDTAFRIRDPEVSDERRDLLRRPGTLCTEPLLEPIPRYASDALGFTDLLVPTPGDPLTGFTEQERLAFVELVLAGLFRSRAREDHDASEHRGLSRIPRFNPYSHQMEMLRRGVKAGTPGIVTSGTGSGKTESFLLPLLASIVREGTGWPEPEPGYLVRRWWHGEDGRPYTKKNRAGHDVVSFGAIPLEKRPTKKAATRSPFRAHRVGERRTAAVRALILYPMNALVEDQLVRLRKALDSREARSVMETSLHGNRIFFGRYTGATPVTGHHLHPGLERLLASDPNSLGDECVFFPEHKDAVDGKVRLTDVRQGELERRKRRLEDLFDYMVDAEEGQRAARLYAVERRALDEMKVRFPAGASPEPRAIVQAMLEIGGLSRASAWATFEDLAGREPNEQEATEILPSLLSVEAAQRAASSSDDEAPFMFPSTDGSELVSRWDMQEHPPDVLITNVSMLSAMLNREVDAPIFDKTRAWLREPNAYFYLVMDELHLQRGAAGTEVAYLLRLLFQRLGLTESPEQLAKVRVLASSASLPAAPPEEAKKSAAYLWDMFGRYGLAEVVLDAELGRSAWLNSIVPGTERQSRYTKSSPPSPLDPTSFHSLLAHYQCDTGEPAAASELDPVAQELWRKSARALGVPSTSPIPDVLREIAQEISERLVFACWDGPSERGRTRATSLSLLRERLFREEGVDSSLSVRALLFARGAAQNLMKEEGSASTFRLHTFFRSLEGLYAPAVKAQSQRAVGPLSIERESRATVHMPDGEQEARLLELVYCECCGELFFGGLTPDAQSLRRSDYVAELLPHEPHLDGLPDRSASQRFEDLSWQQHRIFWPTSVEQQLTQDEDDPGKWIPAALEINTGGIKLINKGLGKGVQLDVAKADPGSVLGFYYERGARPDRHKRQQSSAGTNVPYACPRCQTSYSRRTTELRLSPLRNFRAGFGKTTQLLATELFDAQRIGSTEPAKLVSFSDSRQDAARGALSIERGHHQDIRRELLVLCLKSAQSSRRPRDRIEEERQAILLEIQQRMNAGEDIADLALSLRQLGGELRDQAETSIPLSSILEGHALDQLTGKGRVVLPFIAEHVRKGIHPFDESSMRSVKGLQDGEDRWFRWEQLFDSTSHEIRWRDEERNQSALEMARKDLVVRVYRALTEVVFSKTYFSFEEAGQGFATISCRGAEPATQGSRDRIRELAGLLRVLADCYRYDPNPYRKDGDEYFAPWSTFAEVGAKRVRRYAEASWPANPAGELARALQDLGEHEHRYGVISVRDVRLQLVSDDEPYFRCRTCGRVHLHRGTGICTRCFASLGDAEGGLVRNLRSASFLGRRVSRALRQEGARGIFRLHCEELTGQTDDPATRQREFKGIFVPEWTTTDDENAEVYTERLVASEDRAFRAKKEIDLLTVTTTMEVGIDIGPLQVVMQANMPPQRFNYQQRVGRAGRRGQAFSMALTICRTRSHDLYYFRHPEKMTGDIPPTPFLTKDMSNIARRFLRKAWLVGAFGAVRAAVRVDGGIFPGDLMSPPDIHGEFLPSAFWPEAGGEAWRDRTDAALRMTEPLARTTRQSLNETLVAGADDEVARMLEDIDIAVEHGREPGLAHTLAERGLLPMYGMPTRVRRLYLGLRAREGEIDWDCIDRDIDLAIYEFAPGSVTVRDKQEHLAVGLTPDLAPPVSRGRQGVQDIKAFQDRPWGHEFYLVECGHCHAWKEVLESGDGGRLCGSCGHVLSVEPTRVHRCWIPNAFRTNFLAKPSQEDSDAGVRHRSIQAEGKALNLTARRIAGGNRTVEFNLAFDSARTYRLNRGGEQGNGMGFDLEPGVHRLVWGRRTYLVPAQAVSAQARLKDSVRTFEPSGEPMRVWLAAAKTTDSMFLAPVRNPAGLALHRLPGRSETATPLLATMRWLGVRAAALSAAYILASRAALELDIDPEEFDVLEPRMYGSGLGQLPILQVTDRLVNGAGFTKALCTGETETAPLIAHILHSILNDTAEYPLREFIGEDHARCDTACYRCLLRYGNQPFHGILDWQLGLAYLRAMTDPEYECGLGGSFEGVELDRWIALATRLAQTMAKRFGGEFHTFAGLPAFRVGLPKARMSRWVLVAHPLWDWDARNGAAPGTLLDRATQLAGEDEEPLCWDTFNLSRRQVRVREWVRSEPG